MENKEKEQKADLADALITGIVIDAACRVARTFGAVRVSCVPPRTFLTCRTTVSLPAYTVSRSLARNRYVLAKLFI